MSVVNEGGSPLELPRVTKTAWKVLIATSLTNFAVGLDMSMTNVAIPDIQRSFPSASTADLSWAITFYMVAYAGFLDAQGRYPEAIDQLLVAAEDRFYQSRPTVYENLGRSYLRLDDVNNAIAALERAIALNNNQSRALLELAELKLDQQNKGSVNERP